MLCKVLLIFQKTVQDQREIGKKKMVTIPYTKKNNREEFPLDKTNSTLVPTIKIFFMKNYNSCVIVFGCCKENILRQQSFELKKHRKSREK